MSRSAGFRVMGRIFRIGLLAGAIAGLGCTNPTGGALTRSTPRPQPQPANPAPEPTVARAAAGQGLPPPYHALFRVWFLCGIPAFSAVLAILWLMLARPAI